MTQPRDTRSYLGRRLLRKKAGWVSDKETPRKLHSNKNGVSAHRGQTPSKTQGQSFWYFFKKVQENHPEVEGGHTQEGEEGGANDVAPPFSERKTFITPTFPYSAEQQYFAVPNPLRPRLLIVTTQPSTTHNPKLCLPPSLPRVSYDINAFVILVRGCRDVEEDKCADT